MGGASFDRIAAVYQVAEYLTMGGALQRARVTHLARVASARSVLVLGEGDGRFLRQLLRMNRQCQVLAVDASPLMARLARQRLGGDAARVTFITEDASRFLGRSAAEPQVDVVVTLFFLDCFELPDVAALVQQLAARLAPGGVWLYADFTWPKGRIRRFLAGLWLKFLYFVFTRLTGIRARCLVDPQPFLSANGLRLEASRTSLGGALVSTVWGKQQ
jgi:spermidine synthase